MTKTHAARAAAGALAVLLVLAGCSSKAKDGDGGDDGTASAGGVKTDVGVSAKTIEVGALTDMTGVYATLGKSVTQAQQLYVKQLNAAGGVCGRQVALTVRDHGYDPQKAVSGYTELEPKVLGFAQFIGSPFVAAVKARVDGQDKVVVLPQAWAASLLGSPYIRVIGSTYDVETINAIDFLINEKGIKKGDKIGHVYFEGDYGESALEGAKYMAEQSGLTIVEQKIKPTDNDMTAQVAALKQAGVKAIVISAGRARPPHWSAWRPPAVSGSRSSATTRPSPRSSWPPRRARPCRRTTGSPHRPCPSGRTPPRRRSSWPTTRPPTPVIRWTTEWWAAGRRSPSSVRH